MPSPASGKLIVISGPSGVGKSTVVRRLIESCGLPLELSVSATTRSPRPGETEGVDYWFLTAEEFEARRQQGAFLECAEVFGKGHWYGTLQQPVDRSLQEGRWVILEIDVNGARQVIKKCPHAVTIFIHPGDMQVLERRLRKRGTESEEQMQHRLAVAQAELDAAPQYTHLIENKDVQTTAEKICGLLTRMGEQRSCMTR